MIVKRIGPMSLAKISGVVYAFFGFLAGAVVSIASMAGAMASGTDEGAFAGLIGVGAIIVLPIVYGVIGAIASPVGALVYNLVAGMIGGVEIDVS